MLYYREKQMWKYLVSDVAKGFLFLGTAICLVAFMNSLPDGQNGGSTLVSAAQVQGPLEAAGPKEDPFASTGKFIQPTQGVLTSEFGSRWGRKHNGIDIGNDAGTEILAADSGRVVYAGWMDGYGNYVIIDHGSGLETAYAHCSELVVSEGDCVMQGERIAYMGSTGNSTGSHLHFEIKREGVFQNPMEYGLY